jgi:hypothetical protein
VALDARHEVGDALHLDQRQLRGGEDHDVDGITLAAVARRQVLEVGFGDLVRRQGDTLAFWCSTRIGAAAMPWRMWLYPIPVVLVIIGWLAIYASAKPMQQLAALVAPVIGTLIYVVFIRRKAHA